MNSLIGLSVCLAVLSADSSEMVYASTRPPASSLTAARLSEVDDDFQFQGEYLGLLGSPERSEDRMGLQVTALGGGQFSAQSYSGGLPGNGADLSTCETWKGRRTSGRLVLRLQDRTLIVADAVARVRDAQGNQLGQLGKVMRISKTMGTKAPVGATVLFDGATHSQLDNARTTPEGWLLAGAVTRAAVHDFQLHLEFRVPYKPAARDQGRGNSGIYIQQRYEVQVLDSFGLPPVFNGAAALYRQRPPSLNMCFPPLTWQTYDIYFRSARWDTCGKKRADARISVLHNGVLVHADQVVPSKTGHGKPEGPIDLPILFQNHGNPVQYRNLWLVKLSDTEKNARRRITRRRR